MSGEIDSRPTASFILKLRLGSETVEVESSVPDGKVRLDEVLQVLRQIDDTAIDWAARKATETGRSISCCRGCSTCCRAQPVPVTPAEAYAIWLLVQELPEPRRSEVRTAFAERAQQLFAAGLAQAYLERDAELSKAEAQLIARRYFSLQLACPFLADDGACGIYARRPFVCRQYLVTSPAELCANPFDNPVEVLPLPIAAATAFQKVSTAALGREQFTIPLTLALEYVALHREELERTFESRELLEQCLQSMVD